MVSTRPTNGQHASQPPVCCIPGQDLDSRAGPGDIVLRNLRLRRHDHRFGRIQNQSNFCQLLYRRVQQQFGFARRLGEQ